MLGWCLERTVKASNINFYNKQPSNRNNVQYIGGAMLNVSTMNWQIMDVFAVYLHDEKDGCSNEGKTLKKITNLTCVPFPV